MKKLSLRFVIQLSLMALLLAGLSGLAMAQGPRPTVEPPNPNPGPQPPGGDQTEFTDATADHCASLFGEVINWGFGGQGDVVLALKDGGWETYRTTADDGRYIFGDLGMGVGILSVNPGALPLTPMINDAAIRLTCDFPTQANIGLYSGETRPVPPATLSMEASTTATQISDPVDLTLTVKNTLPNPISNVIITDLIPTGYLIEKVDAGEAQVEVIEGKMLTVFVGTLAANGEATISVGLRQAEELNAPTPLTNTATLFYAEGVADQASITLIASADGTTSEVASNAPAESGSTEAAPSQPEMSQPVSADLQPGEVIHTIAEGEILYEVAPTYDTTFEAIMARNGITNPRRLQIGQALIIPASAEMAAQAAPPTPAASDAPMPTTLPVTGLGLSLSFVGLALGIIALLSRGLRSINRRFD